MVHGGFGEVGNGDCTVWLRQVDRALCTGSITAQQAVNGEDDRTQTRVSVARVRRVEPQVIVIVGSYQGGEVTDGVNLQLFVSVCKLNRILRHFKTLHG